MYPRPSDDPGRADRPGREPSRSRRLAIGLGVATLVLLALLLGSVAAFGNPSEGSPASAQAALGPRTPTKTGTIKPTKTPTATFPSGATPTATPTISCLPATLSTVVACPPAGCPQQLPPTGDWVKDQIWYGAVPPGGGTDKPVLMFVHGLTDIAQDWWSQTTLSGVNDMYLLAYNAGYRTAFVTLQQDNSRGCDTWMYTNGQNLATQINLVAQHYGVSKVTLVTHSKGGVDAQAAIAFYGANAQVDQVFMLSSPNLGSALANSQCQPTPTPVTNSISAICSMTTTYMAKFRSVADPKLATAGVTFWDAGGTDWGPPGSALNAAGALLFACGVPGGCSNDGFVTVTSATTLAGSKYLFVRSVNHDSIRVGHNAFPIIQAVLQEGIPATPNPTGVPTVRARRPVVPFLLTPTPPAGPGP